MTPLHRRSIIIADPSLADARGHHFELTRQISQGAVSLYDMDVSWATNKRYQHQPSDSNIPVFPLFTYTMYDRYRLDRVERDFDPTEQTCQEVAVMMDIAIDKHVDALFFHTAYMDIYESVIRLYGAPGWKELPVLHLCTPYDCDTMPGRTPQRPISELFMRLRNVEALERRLYLWAETPQLAVDYASRFAMTVRALPLPPPIDPLADFAVSSDPTVKVLFLGAAREEKGFLQLPDLLERLYPVLGKTGKIHFIIQCTPQIIGYLPAIKAAINRIAQYPSDYVTLIEDFVERETYLKLLMESDVLLLLYNQKGYRIRGSGIAVEAISANKTILTTRNTFCSSLITHGGGASVDCVEEGAEFLKLFVANKTRYRQLAEIQGKAYREKNSIQNYLSNLFLRMDAAMQPPFYPSALIGYISPVLIDM